MLDEPQDPAHLLDGSLLAPDVVHVHAEVGVVGVDHRLADARVDVEGPEEEDEVRGKQEQDVKEIREAGDYGSGQRVQRLLRGQAGNVVRTKEIENRYAGDEKGSSPEDCAVGLHGSGQRIGLG